MHTVEYHIAFGSRRLDEYVNIEWSETNKQTKTTKSNRLDELRNTVQNETNKPKNIANYYAGPFVLVKFY